MKKLTLQANQNGAGVMACRATKIPKVVPEEVARAAANSLATSSTILFAKVDGNATTEGYEGNQSSVTIDGDRYVFFDPLSKKPFNIVSEDGTKTQVNVDFSSDDIVMNSDIDTYNIKNYINAIPYTGQPLDNAEQWYTIADQTGKTITFRGAFTGLKLNKIIRNPNYNNSNNNSYNYSDPESGKGYWFNFDKLFHFVLERVDATQPYYADDDFNQPIGYKSNKIMSGFIQVIYNEADFTNGVPEYLLNEANQKITSFGFDGVLFTFATTLFGKTPDDNFGNTSMSKGVVNAEFDSIEGLTYHDPENYACAYLGVTPGTFENLNVGDSFTLSSHERKAFKIPANKTGYYIVPTSLPIDTMLKDYVGCNCIIVTENMTDRDYCFPHGGSQGDNIRNSINIFGGAAEGYNYLLVTNFSDSSIDLELTNVAPSYRKSSQAYKAAIYACVDTHVDYMCCLPSELDSSYKNSFALGDAITTFSSSQSLQKSDSSSGKTKYSAVELTNVKSDLVMKGCYCYLVVVTPTDDGNYVATKVASFDHSRQMCILELTEDEIANGRIFIAGGNSINTSTTITQMSAEQKELYYQRKSFVEAGINFDASDDSAILNYMNKATQFSKDPLNPEDIISFDTYNDCTAVGATCLLDSDTELARIANPDTVFRGEKSDGSLYNGSTNVYLFMCTKNSSGNYVIRYQWGVYVHDDSGHDSAEGKVSQYIYHYFGTDVEQVTLAKRNSSSYNLRVTVPA